MGGGNVERGVVLAALVALVGAGTTLVSGPRVARAQAGASDEESQIYVEEARAALAKKDYALAGRLLDKALKVNPRRIDAYVLRATVHALRKEYDQGIAVLRRARALAPDNPHVLTALGTQLVLGKKYDEGVALLEDVVRRWPDRYEAHAALAHYYEGVGRWADATVEFNAYFKTRPSSLAREDATHQVDLANALLRSGDPRAARTLYQKILTADGKSAIARLGLGWSIAAIDCAAAIPVLRGLADLVARYPEVLLVEGRCEMILGRSRDALESANNYSKLRPDAAEGWGLLGEARLSTGDLKGASVALREALERAPDNQLYSLYLARVERLQGQPVAAAARLQKAGAPAEFEDEWTHELGEALLADGRAAEAARLLAPWAEAHATDASARVLLGIALAESGDAPGAILHLEQTLVLRPTQQRARAPLAAALGTVAVAAFRRADYAQAEARLVRAAKLGDDPLILRNLGAVRLIAGNGPGAVDALERAAKLTPDAITLHLLGRAYAAVGKDKQADATLGQALKLASHAGTADSAHALDVRLDLASVQLTNGDSAESVATLEPAFASTDATRGPRVRAAYFVAARAAATGWMRVGAFERATRQLEEAAQRLPKDADELSVAVRCDLALAATGAGLRDAALRRLRELERDKSVCPFVTPADRLAVPILIAWNEGTQIAYADKALKRLEAIRKLASGPARPLVREAARVITLRAAAELYAKGNVGKARAYLAKARKYEDTPSAELLHDEAVMLLEDGQLDAAIAGLEAVAADVPEAYVNLGVAWERKGNSKKALEQYRRAATANVRFAPLRKWIAAKERIWGVEGGG